MSKTPSCATKVLSLWFFFDVMRLQTMQTSATVNVKKNSVRLQVAPSVWGWQLAVQPMQKQNEL